VKEEMREDTGKEKIVRNIIFIDLVKIF